MFQKVLADSNNMIYSDAPTPSPTMDPSHPHLLPKPLRHGGVAAALAEGLGGGVVGEALIDGVGAWRREDFLQTLGVEVAQVHVAVMVQTTGDHGAVDEYANLVAESIAEHLFAGVGFVLEVGPFKHVVALDIQVLCQSPAIVSLDPRARLVVGYQTDNLFVHAVVAAFVPQPQHDDAPSTSCLFGEGHHLVDILLEVLLAVTLVRVQGNLQLMGQSLEHILPLRQQRAVGGNHRDKPFLPSRLHKLGQMGMKERFAHEVEIQKLDPTCEPAGQQVKLLKRHRALWTRGLGAEDAVEVADICRFKITTCNHIIGKFIDFYYILIHDASHSAWRLLSHSLPNSSPQHAPHGYEEGHGEVGGKAMEDAQRHIALAYRLGDDGQRGVHRRGATRGYRRQRPKPLRHQWRHQQRNHLADDVGQQGDGTQLGTAIFGDEDTRQRVVGKTAVYGQAVCESAGLDDAPVAAQHDGESHHRAHPRAQDSGYGQECQPRIETLEIALHIGVEANAHTHTE